MNLIPCGQNFRCRYLIVCDVQELAGDGLLRTRGSLGVMHLALGRSFDFLTIAKSIQSCAQRYCGACSGPELQGGINSLCRSMHGVLMDGLNLEQLQCFKPRRMALDAGDGCMASRHQPSRCSYINAGCIIYMLRPCAWQLSSMLRMTICKVSLEVC